MKTDEESRKQISAEVDLLCAEGRGAAGLTRVTVAAIECLVKTVSCFACGELRRLVLTGEETSLFIETSLRTAEIKVY